MNAVEHLQVISNNLAGMIKLDEWLLKKDCHYSFKSSFDYAAKCGYTISTTFNPKDPDSEKKLPVGERNLPIWGVTPLGNYQSYTNE